MTDQMQFLFGVQKPLIFDSLTVLGNILILGESRVKKSGWISIMSTTSISFLTYTF